MTEAPASSSHEYSWRENLHNKWDLVNYLRPDLLRNPRVETLRSWINDTLKTLPEMDVTQSDLTDGEVWLAVLTPDKVNVIKLEREDKSFLTIEGRKVKKTFADGHVVEWNQPVIFGKEELISVPTLEGQKTLPVHGFLGIVSDTNGDILMRIDQELMSENENHASVMLAIQASVSKIALIQENDPRADKGLASLLEKLAGGNIENLLTKIDNVVPIVSEDPNREFKHNLLISFQPIETGSSLYEELAEGGKNRWCSRAEIDALALSRLTNGHTLSAIRTWEALRSLNPQH